MEPAVRNVKTIMVRELGAFFYSPVAYVVLTVFLILSGFFFAFETFTPGGEASLRPLFAQSMPLVLVFVLPLLAMRLISDEYRSGTIETLMTAPVTDLDVILGKFLGVGVFYMVMLASTLVYAIIISMYGDIDLLLLTCNYIGLILLGGLYLSVGLLFSAMSSNQIIAGLTSLVVLLVFGGFVFPGFLRPWPAAFGFGDRIIGDSNAESLGQVMRKERGHAFPNGLIGDAYLLRTADGQERWYPATDLENHFRAAPN